VGTLTVAAVGDLHASEEHREQLERAFAEPGEGVDLILHAGDLTTHRSDAVFHGHAHHGRPTGAIGTVPVHNVALHVLAEDFCLARF
jgi:hypothetical protein